MRTGAHSQRSSSRGVGWLKHAFFGLACGLLLYMAAKAIWTFRFASFDGTTLASLAALLVAGTTYLAGHFLRIARLALIASDARLSLRLLTRIHLFTAGVGLALPFKLGDAYRAVELAAVAGGMIRGITLVYVERVFDVAMILLLLIIAFSFGPPTITSYAPVLIVSLLFVSITLAVLVLLPENLRRMSSYIIRRYEQEWTVGALRRIADVRAVISSTATMLNGRYASLFAFTALIWALEAISLAIVLGFFSSEFQPLTGLLTFLSSITEGETLLDRLSPESLHLLSPAAVVYLGATQVPLVFLAMIAAIQLLGARVRGVSRTRSRGWSGAK